MNRVVAVAWAVLLACCVLTRGARAQYAPEGNAHPQTQMLSVATGSPFGDAASVTAPCAAQDKVRFARSVDLAPLRSLSVFHDGRVKVVETLARETVRSIAGRKAYRDYLRTPGGGGATAIEAYDFDPLFTLLDLTIDPGYYSDKALIAVGYLPLRRGFLEGQFPRDTDTQERWMRVGRVTPQMYLQQFQAIEQAHMSDAPMREAMDRVHNAMELWRRCGANMLLVAPASRQEPWGHLASLAPDSPARKAALALGEAWRARNAAGVNQAARDLAMELPRINSAIYPTTKRSIEMAYNRANAFEFGAWGYFFALVSLLLAFGTGRTWLKVFGVSALCFAVALHAFGFISRCIIAERFAIQNQYESMTGLSLFAATVGLSILAIRRQWLFAAATSGVGFIVLLAATQAAIPGASIEREAPILNTSVLLKYHVTTVLASYGLIALGFMVSLFYLAAHYFGRRSVAAIGVAAAGVGTISVQAEPDEAVLSGRERILKDLDTAQMTVLQLAFWTLGVGILLGAWWADHSWGRWWAFDPKETWALLTWIVYLIVIHVRFATGKRRALTTAWLSAAGFVVMLWTYFGVNLILPGLHAYA